MDFGITSVVAITVITYLIGMGCKAWEKLDNKFIPVICGLFGAVLGVGEEDKEHGPGLTPNPDNFTGPGIGLKK